MAQNLDQSFNNSLDSFLSDSPAPNKQAPAAAPQSSAATVQQTSAPSVNDFLNDVPMPKSNGIGMADITSFNRGAEDMAWGAVQFGGEVADQIFGTNAAAGIRSYREKLGDSSAFMVSEKEFNKAQSESSDAKKFHTLGNVAGSMALPIPPLFKNGGYLKTGFQVGAQGAIASALMWDASDKLHDSLRDSVIGFAVGAPLGTLAPFAGDLLDGWRAGKVSTNSFIDSVESSLKNKYGKGATGDPGKIEEAIKDEYKNVYKTKEAVYQARNDEADKIGIEISFDDERKQFAQQIRNGRLSPDQKAAVKSLFPYIPKSDKGLSVAQAFDWMKELKTLAKGNATNAPLKSIAQNDLASTYQSKISDAIESSGSTKVQELSNIADKYYATTYIPIKTVATYKAADKLTEDSFVDMLINQYPKVKAVNTTINSLPPASKDEIFTYSLQSAREAATENSNLFTQELDISKYATNLGNKMGNNPLYANAAEDLKAAGQALSYFGLAAKQRSKGLSYAVGLDAAADLSPAKMLAAFGLNIPKLQAIAGLGRAMKNPAIRELLSHSSTVMKNKAAQPITEAVLYKTGKALATVIGNEGLSGRILALARGDDYSVPYKEKDPTTLTQHETAVGGIRG